MKNYIELGRWELFLAPVFFEMDLNTPCGCYFLTVCGLGICYKSKECWEV